MKQWVFCYGSNSIAQLRGRVGNNDVQGRPAHVVGWARIFCLESKMWGGSVASLAKVHEQDQDGEDSIITFGSIVELNSDELKRLDKFEGGYSQAKMIVRVGHCTKTFDQVEAIAYISNDPQWKGFPGQQYLTAIHLMLSEQYPKGHPSLSHIDIFGLPTGKNRPIKLKRHEHPTKDELGLESLVVWANSRRSTPWEMPRTIEHVRKVLSKRGISKPAHLRVFLENPGNVHGLIDDILDKEGIAAFEQVLNIKSK
mmetsp:Transcript_5506/g.8530  ORF Transcript_5506/g.8530 Transcript_5506/m.8530 type:complete len:255 (-) Transcript_5506:7363-8127(-)